MLRQLAEESGVSASYLSQSRHRKRPPSGKVLSQNSLTLIIQIATIWDIDYRGINLMLRRLSAKTGLPCNPHTFRRTFASILAKRGVDSLHIKRLGRWESLEIAQRYTRSVTFQDSSEFYRRVLSI